MASTNLTTTWSLDLRPATTSSPFITLLSTARLPAPNFNKWLHNDFIYVHFHSYFLARLISIIPESRSSFRDETLVSGYNVLTQELDLFRSKALQRGVELPKLPLVNTDYKIEATRDPQKVLEGLTPTAATGCAQYMRFLMTLCKGEHHWTTLLAVLWMCERVYFDSMASIRHSEKFKELDESIQDFVKWWSNDEFGEYVKTVEEAAANGRVEGGWREEEARGAVEEVLVLERGFWDIATDGLEL